MYAGAGRDSQVLPRVVRELPPRDTGDKTGTAGLTLMEVNYQTI